MRAHHERDLWFGESDFSCRFNRTHWRTKVACRTSRFLVASPPVRELLFLAKDLFVAATLRTDAFHAST
jgi:hypothetical protein